MALDPEGTSGEDKIEYDYSEEVGGKVPAGEYTMVLMDITTGFTREKAAPKIDWHFQVWDDKSQYDGFRPFPLVTVKSPQALWKEREVVSALGLGLGGQKGTFRKGDAVGRRVIASLVDDEFRGEVRSKIDRVRPHPDGPIMKD